MASRWDSSRRGYHGLAGCGGVWHLSCRGVWHPTRRRSPKPAPPPGACATLARSGTTGDDRDIDRHRLALPPELPAPLAAELDRHFPRRPELSDAVYRLEYDLTKKVIILHQRSGSRKEPPPPAFLPRFAGLAVKIRQGQSSRTVRGRG